jgi:Na+/melibiose symporter-like transporter
VFAAIGTGLTSALGIYINTYFWELSSDQLSLFVLGLFLSALLAVAIAPRISRPLGKKRAAMVASSGALLLGPAPIVLRLLGLFPDNGAPALLPTLIGFNVATVALLIAGNILVASMIADLVEDSELNTGRRAEGVFVAASTFVMKAVSGVGIFGSGLLLGAVGFPRDAKPGLVDPAVIRQLALIYVSILVTVYAIAIGFLSAYRIDRATHEDNLRRLAGARNG